MEFHRFPDLDPEIRLMTWDEALLAARDTRTVLINEDRIMPLPFLVSPLLSASYESRARAQGFYTLKLDVLLAPPPPIATIVVPYRASGIAYEVTYADMVKKGALYISPEHDILVLGSDHHGLDFFLRESEDAGSADNPRGRPAVPRHPGAYGGGLQGGRLPDTGDFPIP